jgi:hypothetical protein
MNRSRQLLSLLEQEFEYRQLDDLLNTIRQFEPGEYDLSGVESVFTTSAKNASLDEVQAFITRYHRVCFIKLEGYSDGAKSLILMSDEPKKLGNAKAVKDGGAVIYKDRLFANNLK